MSNQPAVLILGWTFVAQLANAELLYCPEPEEFDAHLTDQVKWVCLPLDTTDQKSFAQSIVRNPKFKDITMIGYVQKPDRMGAHQKLIDEFHVHAVVAEDELPDFLNRETKAIGIDEQGVSPEDYSRNPHFHLYRRLEAERKTAQIEAKLKTLSDEYKTLMDTAKNGARTLTDYQVLKRNHAALQEAYAKLEENTAGSHSAEAEADHAMELMQLTMSFAEERSNFENEVEELKNQLHASAGGEDYINPAEQTDNARLVQLENDNLVLQNELVAAAQSQIERLEDIFSKSYSEPLEFDESVFNKMALDIDSELNAFEAELADLKVNLGA